MRMATKPPSEWLRLLCRDWAQENEELVNAADSRFLQYKSYLKGQLTSQLLCRLSISGREAPKGNTSGEADPTAPQSIDFWRILGVEDEFDRAHIVANIERFCSLYNIRGGTNDDPNDVGTIGTNFFSDGTPVDPAAAAAAAAAGLSVASNCALLYPIDPNAAASVANMSIPKHDGKIRQTIKNQQRRLKAEMREREREAYSMRKAAEKAARVATREERRQRKIAMRKQREEYAQKQKEAALRRAADLVHSNRVPIEITRGAAAAQAAANAAVAAAAVPAAETVETPPVEPPFKKGRSSIVISTASDLDQIVTHSNNLWAKYNAIAKEHNQKVNWVVVAKELGIHVKVREKYARMHARAKTRGFDFVNWGHYRIKDYPQYFLDPVGPSQDEQKNDEGSALLPNIPEDNRAMDRPPVVNYTQDGTAEDEIAIAAEAAVVAGVSQVVVESHPAVIDVATTVTTLPQESSYGMSQLNIMEQDEASKELVPFVGHVTKPMYPVPELKIDEQEAAQMALSAFKSVEHEPIYNPVSEMEHVEPVADGTQIPTDRPPIQTTCVTHHDFIIARDTRTQFDMPPPNGHNVTPSVEHNPLKSDAEVTGIGDRCTAVPGDNVAV
ncbi:hypothetical protein ACHAXS_009085 [Conticribra weissflogii]